MDVGNVIAQMQEQSMPPAGCLGTVNNCLRADGLLRFRIGATTVEVPEDGFDFVQNGIRVRVDYLGQTIEKLNI